jgi:transposase-like protein
VAVGGFENLSGIKCARGQPHTFAAFPRFPPPVVRKPGGITVPRPSKFTSRRKERVLAILGAGGSRREAARAAGIDPATLRSWIRRGERSTPEGAFGRFLADVRAAESGQRLVGLEPDRDEVSWAMGVLEREW